MFLSRQHIQTYVKRDMNDLSVAHEDIFPLVSIIETKIIAYMIQRQNK